MKINYHGIEYYVYWKFLRYEPYHDLDQTGKVITIPRKEYTECYIERSGIPLGIQIVTRATKTPPDQFNKEIGRKLSFARALLLLFPDKESRKFFWQCYFEFTRQYDKRDTYILLAIMNNNFAEVL